MRICFDTGIHSRNFFFGAVLSLLIFQIYRYEYVCVDVYARLIAWLTRKDTHFMRRIHTHTLTHIHSLTDTESYTEYGVNVIVE